MEGGVALWIGVARVILVSLEIMTTYLVKPGKNPTLPVYLYQLEAGVAVWREEELEGGEPGAELELLFIFFRVGGPVWRDSDRPTKPRRHAHLRIELQFERHGRAVDYRRLVGSAKIEFF